MPIQSAEVLVVGYFESSVLRETASFTSLLSGCSFRTWLTNEETSTLDAEPEQSNLVWHNVHSSVNGLRLATVRYACSMTLKLTLLFPPSALRRRPRGLPSPQHSIVDL